jgi:glucose-6-phosphate isomerase
MENSKLLCRKEVQGFSLDLRKSGLKISDIDGLKEKVAAAHKEMGKIEAGAIKNPDEGRQVTHFTDRQEYPDSDLFRDVEAFFAAVRGDDIVGSTGIPFESIIVNGIGGSALGPQLLQYAINGPYWNEIPAYRRNDALKIYFTDNTDPSGLFDALQVLDLETTLVVSISKSGGTRETKNNLVAIETAFASVGLNAAAHLTAVTMEGSKLDVYANSRNWLKIWPMAESIGGRTSETAVVGHVPAAAAGIDFDALLKGATTMDEWTRSAKVYENPAYLLACSWYLLGKGKGDRNMVIVPYSDRLVLLSRYLQQLVMESLGKEFDLDGKTVRQGLNVFGNKGGTDAHAFMQQLNDGRNDFFITFIEVLKDAAKFNMGDGLTMGDYLHNFMQGLSNAISGKRRSVLSITVDELSAETMGMLIALYERAVAFYAELINVNAFHQPGVEAYKKISAAVNDVALKLKTFIPANKGFSGDASAFAKAIGKSRMVAEVEGILLKYEANQYDFEGVALKRSLKKGAYTFSIN